MANVWSANGFTGLTLKWEYIHTKKNLCIWVNIIKFSYQVWIQEQSRPIILTVSCSNRSLFVAIVVLWNMLINDVLERHRYSRHNSVNWKSRENSVNWYDKFGKVIFGNANDYCTHKYEHFRKVVEVTKNLLITLSTLSAKVNCCSCNIIFQPNSIVLPFSSADINQDN